VPAENGQLYLGICGASKYLQWKFSVSFIGSTIESIAQPGQCIQGDFPGTYPGITNRCDSTNSSFIFYNDGFGQIYWIDSSQKHICLDVQGGTGPNIGFLECKNTTNTNQGWNINNGLLASSYSSLLGSCIQYNDGTTLPVWIYTNGDSVELFLNGQTFGRQAIAKYGIGQYIVSYQPGVLQAVVTKNNGVPWGTATLATTGPPSYLNLTLERPGINEVAFTDGQDAALVFVSVHDDQGRIVRNVTNLVTFTVSGPSRVLGTGNGKPSDLTPDQSNQRQLWNGLVRAVIGFSKSSQNGTVTVQATSPGLRPSSVNIPTQPRPWSFPEL